MKKISFVGKFEKFYRLGLPVLAMGLCLVTLSPVKTWAGGGVVVGDGTPTSNEPQVVLSEVPAQAEVLRVINGLDPYYFELAEKLRYALTQLQRGGITLVRIDRTSTDQYAGFEAEVEQAAGLGPGPGLELHNITVYLWKNFYDLPVSDEAHPDQMSQAKVILHELLHLVVSFPELRTQRLTEYVYQAGIGQASPQVLDQIGREIADSDHHLGAKENPVTRSLQYFDSLKSTQVDLLGLKITPIPQTWIDAFHRSNPAWKMRISQALMKDWMFPPMEREDDVSRSLPDILFYFYSHLTSNDPNDRARDLIAFFSPNSDHAVLSQEIGLGAKLDELCGMQVPANQAIVLSPKSLDISFSAQASKPLFSDYEVKGASVEFNLKPAAYDLYFVSLMEGEGLSTCRLNRKILGVDQVLDSLIKNFREIPAYPSDLFSGDINQILDRLSGAYANNSSGGTYTLFGYLKVVFRELGHSENRIHLSREALVDSSTILMSVEKARVKSIADFADCGGNYFNDGFTSFLQAHGISGLKQLGFAFRAADRSAVMMAGTFPIPFPAGSVSAQVDPLRPNVDDVKATVEYDAQWVNLP